MKVKTTTGKYLLRATLILLVAGGSLIAWARPADDDAIVPSSGPLPSPPPRSEFVAKLPNGNAKKLVEARCQVCHSLEPVVAFRRTKDQWTDAVHTMMVRGAPVTSEEAPTIIDYLSQAFGSAALFPPAAPSVQNFAPFKGSFRIYVSDQEDATIDVIDPETNRVAQRIKGVTSPDGIVFTLDGRRAFVSDRVQHQVSVIDTATGKIIKKIPVTDRPQLPVITKDGKRVYIGIWPLKPDEAGRGFIDVIDTEGMKKIKTIPTTGGIHDMLITSDGKYLVAGSPMGKFLDCYDLTNDELLWKLPFDRNVQTFAAETAADGSTSRLFVNLRFPGFSVVDFKRHKEVSRITFPSGNGEDSKVENAISDDKAGGGYFVPPGSGSAHGINVAPDGKTLWIDGMGYDTPWFNNVYVYSLLHLKLLGHIHMSGKDGEGKLVGRHGQGHWQTFSPDGKMLYVVSYGLDWVSVIDTKAMKEVTRIEVGATPLHIEQVTIR